MYSLVTLVASAESAVVLYHNNTAESLSDRKAGPSLGLQTAELLGDMAGGAVLCTSCTALSTVQTSSPRSTST